MKPLKPDEKLVTSFTKLIEETLRLVAADDSSGPASRMQETFFEICSRFAELQEQTNLFVQLQEAGRQMRADIAFDRDSAFGEPSRNRAARAGCLLIAEMLTDHLASAARYSKALSRFEGAMKGTYIPV